MGTARADRGQFDLDWLGAIVNRLYERGISVDLATGKASPPPWLSRRYPGILPQGPDGTRLWPGAGQAWCPSSPVFREKSGISVASTWFQRNIAKRPGELICHTYSHVARGADAVGFFRWRASQALQRYWRAGATAGAIKG